MKKQSYQQNYRIEITLLHKVFLLNRISLLMTNKFTLMLLLKNTARQNTGAVLVVFIG